MIPADQKQTAVAAAFSSASPPAAFALAAASIATLALLAHHPVAGRTHADPAGLQAIAHLGGQAALVHSALIVVVGALLYGVIALALRLGLRRPAVAFGIAIYGAGCASMTVAMLLDGFVVARLAEHLLASGQPPEGQSARALAWIAIQVFTRAGFFGMGIGVCLLSWSRAGAGRLLAILALPAAVLPMAALAISGIAINPRILIALTGLQAVWYLGAAWRLWPGGFPDRPALRR
jgi:hypothetical protein